MEDYQGNSKKLRESIQPKPEKKSLEKVVTADAIIRPPSIWTKFKRVFFGGDAQSAGQYVMAQVLLPALRSLASDVISKGSDRLIYGDSAPTRRPYQQGPRVMYNNPVYYGQQRANLPDRAPRWGATGKALDDVIVASKEDAEVVIDQMTAAIDQYEVVSVADLYELLGLETPHVYNKWGWTHLGNLGYQQTRDGWKILFPPIEEIQ